MIDEPTWRMLRRMFHAAFVSSLHVSLGSIDSDGSPRVTPLGSLLLGDLGHAFYFELYATELGRRLTANPQVSVLAVDSARGLWLPALVSARFKRLPGARLYGQAAAATRASTEEERARLRRRFGVLRKLPGGRALWPGVDGPESRALPVRDIRIDRVEALRLGPLTVDLRV